MNYTTTSNMNWFITKASQSYTSWLYRYPLPVKCITSGLLVGASDFCSQMYVKKEWDPIRTLVLGVGYGSCVFAPVLHSVFLFWSKVLPSNRLPVILFKTSVDMITSFPLNLSVMIGLQTMLQQGKQSFENVKETSNKIKEAVKENLWPSLVGGWKLWPMVSICVYGFVPLHFRVVSLNVVSFGWNIWMISRLGSS